MKQVFVSYSHKDEAFRRELDSHLAMLRRQGVIEVFTDHCIPAGGEFDEAIRQELERADVVLLLVSADFLNSEYCFGVEMQRSIERHDAGQCRVVPIIVRPCDWEPAPFRKLKALPKDGKPVASWADHDEPFSEVAKALRTMLAASSPRAAAALARQAPAPAAAAAPQRRVLTRLPREFTDQDKHDFTHAAFTEIRAYFSAALTELEHENLGLQARLTETSARAFQVVVFKHGKKVAGCYIRIGGFGETGIAYTNGDAIAEGSFNEIMSVQNDDNTLFFKPTMSMFDSRLIQQMSPEQAAEFLLEKLLGPLHR